MTSKTTLADHWWNKYLGTGLNELQHELTKVLNSFSYEDAAEAALRFDNIELRLETTLLLLRQVQGLAQNVLRGEDA